MHTWALYGGALSSCPFDTNCGAGYFSDLTKTRGPTIVPQFRQRRRTGLLYTLLALITVVSTTCVDLPFQPGQTVTASLDVAALLSAAQSSPIPIDAFVVELRRTSDS